MDYQTFKNKTLGKLVDDGDGNYKGECVSLVKNYIKIQGWPFKRGNAIDWQKNGDDFYKWVKNTPTGVPEQGDFIIFSVGKYGHIGIVDSATSKEVFVLNQNWPHGNDTDPVQITRFDYIKPQCVGWLHPTPTSPAKLIADYKAQILSLLDKICSLCPSYS